MGNNSEIFFPKLQEKLNLISFPEIIVRYLQRLGYDSYECGSEDEARGRAEELISQKKWPCYFFDSDTTGEKDFEEFYTDEEDLDMTRFETMGVIRNKPDFDTALLKHFASGIGAVRAKPTWCKDDIVHLFFDMLPDFAHKETGKYLDQKM